MNAQYVIPKKAISYSLFQRTAYLKYTHSLLYRAIRKISPISLYKQTVQLESVFRSEKITSLYMADMEREYLNIKNHLPEICESIVDVGCGIAGINIFLNQHYKDKAVQFFLLDKSKVEDNVFYLFKPKGAFYNSLELAGDVLKANGIPQENIHLVEANDKNEMNIKQNVDLIISLISWGFHYPISTYLERAYELLNAEGRLIIDVRKNTDGEEALVRLFGNVEVIDETDTRKRFVAVKKGI